MQITQAVFTNPPMEADPAWVLQLDVVGSGFIRRAAPLWARVGDVPVEALFIKTANDGFVGMLATLPPEGAELEIGYIDEGLIGTGFFYNSNAVV